MTTPPAPHPDSSALNRPGPTASEPGPAPARPELTLPGTVLGATVAVVLAAALALVLLAVTGHAAGTSYDQWTAELPGNLAARARWALGDMTEPQFYKSPIAAIGLLAGATLGWWAGRRGYRWAGRAISYGSGLWPWILGAATLSLALSNLAFGWRLRTTWQPTFIPFVCVATGIVLIHGRGWPVLLTGAVLGAATTTPLAMLLIATITGPLGLPLVVANTAAMSIGTTVSYLLCRVLPWMPGPAPAPTESPAPATEPGPMRPPTVVSDAVWTARRVLTDFTETQFYANELASLGVLAGIVIAVLADPTLPAYGTGLIPHILLAQALTSAVGVIMWRALYRHGGWAPTYISVVSVAPAAVITYHGSATAIVVGALAGALLCPVIARPISARLPADFHPFIGNTTSMAISTAIIVPLIGLLPGT
ncbi:hypothetical protein LQ327_09490 [Actinomycetospora endophytica]|uniref:Integral membrane protein n=1 Tax=Actinomycetospora endophytica TaxID=2291215 RepID=A0ABS8P5T8_9PSEU|nr:hypothetical protein [Actinomycetospora endophytica]MCD2193613.1 hypothetical protein [Actinomycetospora endophytica]